jgi:hypothetical protein
LHVSLAMTTKVAPIADLRVRKRDIAVAIGLSLSLLSGCDTFFGARGTVTDCASAAPLPGVGIDVHVDNGFDGRMESLPNVATTNAAGHYKFDINDPNDSWATLTFHLDGYTPLTPPQFRGHDQRDPPVDVCLAATAAP